MQPNDLISHEVDIQDAKTHEVSLAGLVVKLFKHRRSILYFTLGALALAIAVALLLPNQYTATTLIMPPSQITSGAALMGQFSGGGGLAAAAGASLGLKSPGDMYVALFRSASVENLVIQRLGLSSRYHTKLLSVGRAVFEGRTKVAVGPKDGLITVSVIDSDPKLAADIANGYVDAFRSLSAHLAISEASQRSLFFQQQLLEANGNLAMAEEALKGTEQSTGVPQISTQTQTLIQSASSLRAEIVAKEVQLQGMRTFAAEDHPEVVEAKQQIAALQAQLAKLGGNERGLGTIVPQGKVSEAELEYLRRVRDVRYNENLSQLLSKQLEMAKLDEARQGALIQVVDVAVPPDRKSSPRRSLIVIAATFLGFLLACLWFYAVEGLIYLKNDPGGRGFLDNLKAILR